MNTARHDELAAGARQYLDSSTEQLDDLPIATRIELASDIADALAEHPSDTSFDELVQRLGSPSEFAAELRRSSGSVARSETPDQATAPTLQVEPPPTPASEERPRRASSALEALEWVGRELDPLWWVIRGMAIASALFFATIVAGFDFGYSRYETLVTIGLIAVIASMARGIERHRGERLHATEPSTDALRRRGALVIVLGGMFMLMLANVVSSHDPYRETPQYIESSPGLLLDGSLVSNIYAFDASGKRLDRVRLYTDSHAPLAITDPGGMEPEINRFTDGSGEDLSNVFPLPGADSNADAVEGLPDGWPPSPGKLRPFSPAEAPPEQ